MTRVMRSSTRKRTEISLASNKRSVVKAVQNKSKVVPVNPDLNTSEVAVVDKIQDESTTTTMTAEPEESARSTDKMEIKAEQDEESAQNKCLAISIPPEIFIEICKNLPPADLLRLARTCKTFHAWLSSKESVTTQRIWAASRKEFVRYLTLPPPRGMDEIAYIRLALEKGCQICGAKLVRKIYWAFRARICGSCFQRKTITNHDIKTDARFKRRNTRNILAGLPFVDAHVFRRLGNRRYYWIDDVLENAKTYKSLPSKKRQDWLIKRQKKGAKLMRNARALEMAFLREERIRSIELRGLLLAKREELHKRTEIMAQTKDASNNFYDIDRLRRCASYQKAYKRPYPLTDRAWNMLYRKLVKEYI
ncbi:5658_t:CDS:2 [Ambispora gerdemannii]|uniref:5658_t:CDS:1 n=1 Tax=Ambispora gerdemannii TaxID=144530 RepID=A0A9N8V814_9GLOM|nr:5658_t:CDS:2 [Ambispora gerdemannii]